MDPEFSDSVVFINYGMEVFFSFLEWMQSEGQLHWQEMCLAVRRFVWMLPFLNSLSKSEFKPLTIYFTKLCNSIPLLRHQCYLIVFYYLMSLHIRSSVVVLLLCETILKATSRSRTHEPSIPTAIHSYRLVPAHGLTGRRLPAIWWSWYF